jgi:hypothetical protein
MEIFMDGEDRRIFGHRNRLLHTASWKSKKTEWRLKNG